MNRSQIRAKKARRKHREFLKKDVHPMLINPLYDEWLKHKGWMWHDPKKVEKRNPWIRKMIDITEIK